ncbi:melanoma antigen preferentially expressed in tumors isoform X1 [Camelus bactrianus]|uniref:Melanoma antigen preferentially expressed in tumors isoform X1 n=2 Tax=Camelus bactrianus TaxID=9837 RepID=A0A9W3EES0_CAMBA|nr:melanoma antigen preferentially expressed in tumors isoform X1 [Camelus bactrianus]
MWPKLPQRVYFQDSFRSRFFRMGVQTPLRLLELAGQSLLRDEALAIAALEELPTELFPPLFTVAFAGRHSEMLKAMVQAWPFPCLPLGALMREHQPHLDTFQAAIDGLDVLLTQEVRPRRWKLQVLDLRRNAHQDFWAMWSSSRASLCSLLEPEAAPPVRKRRRVEVSRAGPKQPSVPVEVLIDLCLKEGTPDQSLTYLLKKVKQRGGSLRLCCQKLKIFAMPMQTIQKVLKMVQLDSVQDLEVNCTWKLATLGRFAPYLGQMGNLRRLLLSHIHMAPHAAPGEEEHCVSQLTAQFLSLHHLQELYLDSISFLEGRLDQVLRCLKAPLETLSITNCLISESDLMHLSQCPSITQLKDLGLSGVSLTNVSSGPLQVLIERTSATLQDLDLDECGIMDAQFSAILPALSRCSQLMTFSFCGNPISMAVLESLLCHTVGLSKLSHVLYPAPLESYEDVGGTLHLGRLAQLHARLKQMLRESGRPSMVWFSANPCPHCGDRTFYDPDPILCPCYMPD